MSKDPAFLFYSSDFLSGVSDLTMEERGQYITLLCLQHQKGHLSEKLISISVGNATADVMRKFSIDKEGLYFSVRLDAEIAKRAEHSKKQRQRAIDGWEKRKATADATALPLENVNEIDNKDLNRKEPILEIQVDYDLIKPDGTIPLSEIPDYKTFLAYTKEQEPNILESSVKYKYNAWVQNKWRDGNNKPIKNWKAKVNHTLPYLDKKPPQQKTSLGI